MRSGEGVSSSSKMPKAYRPQSFTMRTRASSPGAVPGDKYGLAIGTVGHTAAVAGKTFDAQGQDLVFL